MATAKGMGIGRSGHDRNYMDVGESGGAREVAKSNDPAGHSVQRHRSFERFGSVIAAGLLTAGLAGLPSVTSAYGGDGGGNRDGAGEVVLCHIPPGNPENRHTITVSQSAAAAHHRHGDTLGYCDPSEEPLPPGAFADFTPNAILGQPFSYNVLANDFLGNPPGTITNVVGFDANNGCGWMSLDLATGVISGTPQLGDGVCGVWTYTISNPLGSSSAIVLTFVSQN